jgi:hemolysin III
MKSNATDALPEVETRVEEAINCVTHGVGAALAAAALAVLVTLAATRGEARHVVGVSIYGASLLGLYVASTLYHACRCGRPDSLRLRRCLKALDHVGIYCLIAGTYTPFLIVLIRGGWGWTMLCVLWGLALAGTVFKIFYVNRFEVASTLLYVAMGWIGIVGAKPLLGALPGGALAWVLAGGIAYTAGVVFFLWERLPFNHAIWHLFVLVGSACHFLAVLLYVVPAAKV